MSRTCREPNADKRWLSSVGRSLITVASRSPASFGARRVPALGEVAELRPGIEGRPRALIKAVEKLREPPIGHGFLRQRVEVAVHPQRLHLRGHLEHTPRSLRRSTSGSVPTTKSSDLSMDAPRGLNLEPLLDDVGHEHLQLGWGRRTAGAIIDLGKPTITFG